MDNDKNKSKHKIKSLSFTEEYKREYEYLMGIKNASKYVCDLMRVDLDNKINSDNKKECLQLKEDGKHSERENG